jgi:DnaJ-domain-containing protein 1
MQFVINQHKFIKMRVNIKNRLVQQDLFDLINTHPDNLGVYEEDGKHYMIKVDPDGEDWSSRTLYQYESASEVLEDLENLKNIMKVLDI